MNEITILTERIIDHYLMSDKLIVITTPNNKIWYCKKMNNEQYIKFCKDVKAELLVTLHLKDKSD